MLSDRAGAAGSVENLTGDVEFFTLFTTLNVTATGNFADTTQKDFEAILQVIALRSSPVLMNEPVYVDGSAGNTLEDYGAPTLTGAGWIFKFSFERKGVHTIDTLTNELHNIVLNGGTVDTKNTINTEFSRQDLL